MIGAVILPIIRKIQTAQKSSGTKTMVQWSITIATTAISFSWFALSPCCAVCGSCKVVCLFIFASLAHTPLTACLKPKLLQSTAIAQRFYPLTLVICFIGHGSFILPAGFLYKKTAAAPTVNRRFFRRFTIKKNTTPFFRCLMPFLYFYKLPM